MIIEIGCSDLKEVTERRTGNFSQLNPGKPGTTEPWRCLQTIGLLKNDLINYEFPHPYPYPPRLVKCTIGGAIVYKLYDNNRDFSGTVYLKIRGGAVRDSNIPIPIQFSDMFKNEVFPAIKNFSPECGDTFKLTLHYADRLLLKVELEYK